VAWLYCDTRADERVVANPFEWASSSQDRRPGKSLDADHPACRQRRVASPTIRAGTDLFAVVGSDREHGACQNQGYKVSAVDRCPVARLSVSGDGLPLAGFIFDQGQNPKGFVRGATPNIAGQRPAACA